MKTQDKISTVNNFLSYCDVFGTTYSFYTERKPKLYTELGGILSLFSIIVCFIVFIFFSLDDIKRVTPTITTSSLQPNKLKKIRFGEEKIWIPWRIAGNDNHFVNHSNLLFPIIYYYKTINNPKEDGGYEFDTKILNYSLCSESSMQYMTEEFSIDIPLNELYCIEMDDLDMGGTWTSDFINYLQFDLYLCKDGINYDEDNTNCTRYDKLRSEYGSLSISLFYPVVQFHSTDIENPVKIIYREYFYQLSRFSNKLDRLYLMENLFIDDLGWFAKKKIMNSYWGYSYINSDSYSTGNIKDIMDEGSNSRLYSLNIYLDPTIYTYSRSFKKLYAILAESLPVVFVVFKIFRSIANIFKLTSSNKKINELLFENLKEKKDYSAEKQIKKSIYKSEKRIPIKADNKNNKNKINEILANEKSITPLKIERNSFKDGTLNLFKKSNNIIQEINSNCKDNFNSNLSDINERKDEFENSEVVENKRYNPGKTVYYLKQYHNENSQKNVNYPLANINIQNKRRFISKPLFPYRYYFCSIFIKNIDISKNSLCFDKKFAKTYTFLCQLLDISSYIVLQKEFNVLKHTVVDKNKMRYIEKNRKINVNAHAFIRRIDDCINDNNFKIFE